MEDFQWVEAWLREQELIGKIKAIEAEIAEVQSAPRSHDEVRAEIARVKENHSDLADVLKEYQTGTVDSINVGALVVPLVAQLLTDKAIDAALKELPRGMSREEKEAKITTLTARIKGLMEQIRRECWPDDRRVCDEAGNQLPGPAGDRWYSFLYKWGLELRHVSAEGPRDWQGYLMKPGSPTYENYLRLGLNRLRQGGFLTYETLPTFEEKYNDL